MAQQPTLTVWDASLSPDKCRFEVFAYVMWQCEFIAKTLRQVYPTTVADPNEHRPVIGMLASLAQYGPIEHVAESIKGNLQIGISPELYQVDIKGTRLDVIVCKGAQQLGYHMDYMYRIDDVRSESVGPDQGHLFMGCDDYELLGRSMDDFDFPLTDAGDARLVAFDSLGVSLPQLVFPLIRCCRYTDGYIVRLLPPLAEEEWKLRTVAAAQGLDDESVCGLVHNADIMWNARPVGGGLKLMKQHDKLIWVPVHPVENLKRASHPVPEGYTNDTTFRMLALPVDLCGEVESGGTTKLQAFYEAIVASSGHLLEKGQLDLLTAAAANSLGMAKTVLPDHFGNKSRYVLKDGVLIFKPDGSSTQVSHVEMWLGERKDYTMRNYIIGVRNTRSPEVVLNASLIHDPNAQLPGRVYTANGGTMLTSRLLGTGECFQFGGLEAHRGVGAPPGSGGAMSLFLSFQVGDRPYPASKTDNVTWLHWEVSDVLSGSILVLMNQQ